MKNKVLILFGTILLFILGGLVIQPRLVMSETESVTETQKIVNANTEFGLELFSQVWEKQNNQNVFISPSSISFALSMLYNGAQGETAQEMADVLNFSNINLRQVNQQNKALRTALIEADPDVQLAIANSLWLKQGATFLASFLENNQEFYQAKVTELDFNSPEAVPTINSWVKDNTEGKIEEIIDSIDPQQILFLINAVYFKGSWKYQFDPDSTVERTFYLLDGTTKSHPMMSQTGKYPYLETETFQAMSLPYGETENLSMYLFLPRAESDLNAFLAQLNKDNWSQWMSQFNTQEVNLTLPRFQLEYEIRLEDILAQMGMEKVFNPTEADFSAMTSSQVFVDTVKHKTFVEVNEEGTEAAAVTSIGIRVTSIGQTITMEFNRPFFYAIRDNQTGTILFMGAMVEPVD